MVPGGKGLGADATGVGETFAISGLGSDFGLGFCGGRFLASAKPKFVDATVAADQEEADGDFVRGEGEDQEGGSMMESLRLGTVMRQKVCQ